jgi:hypothetical protein
MSLVHRLHLLLPLLLDLSHRLPDTCSRFLRGGCIAAAAGAAAAVVGPSSRAQAAD